MRRFSFAWALTAAALPPAIVPAWGQYYYLQGIPAENLGVMDRARPEYDAKGIPIGGFRLFPTLELVGSYDDNVFLQPSAEADYYLTVAPALRLQSQWGRHFLEFYGGLDNYHYAKYSGEDLTDWDAGSDGRLDISRAATLSANASFGEYHELWSAPNNVAFQAAPNRYYDTHADLAATYQPSRLGVGAGGSFDRRDWTATPLIGGGVQPNGDRNENEYQGYVTSYYQFSPGYSVFVKATYDARQFDQRFDRTGLDRSSHGYRLDGGLNVQISHLVSGQVFVGYLSQRFPADAPNPLPDVAGLDYGAALDWFASEVLTVHLSASRQLADVVLAGVSVADNRRVELSADYEFRPNVIVQAHAAYTDSVYVGAPYSDRYPEAGIAITYLMNRYVGAELDYAYQKRSSNRPESDFNDNTVSIRLKLHV